MNNREVVRLVVGSLTVYVVMAACSAASTGTNRGASANAGGSSGTALPENGGTVSQGTQGSGSIGGGSMLSSVTSPVRDAAAQSTSGTRLKATYQEGTDGSKTYLYYQWYDSQRQENCTFMLADDGTTRCMPAGDVSFSGLYFSDSACTQQLAARTKPTGSCGTTTPQPKYALGSTTTSCGATYQLSSVGALFSGATLYMKSGTTCTSLTASAYTTTMEFYSLGTQIPTSLFVAATIKIDS